VDNIKMDIRNIGWRVTNLIEMPHDRDRRRVLVDMEMNFGVPKHVGEFLSSCTTGSFSRRAQPEGVGYLMKYSKPVNKEGLAEYQRNLL
jgi:hypothetical protein